MARTIGNIGPRTKNGAGGMSRLQQFAQNNLGVKFMGSTQGSGRIFRKDCLDKYDSYFENRQYDGKQDWESAVKSELYVPIRDRKPRIIYNVAKVIVNKVTAKICGAKTFPTFIIEDDPDDTEFFKTVIKAANVRRNLLEPVRRCLLAGGSFVRFFLVNGQPEMEYALAKYCYPKFDQLGELEEIEIKYVYEDWDDLDSRGEPKLKWYRLLMDKMSDVLFDNPEYAPGNLNPSFKELERNDHQLGWVQGEWLATAKNKFDADGPSLIEDILGFIDDLNYSLSQTSQAVGYNQEPQLSVSGVDEEELDQLIRSSQKAWNLGRDGKAEFIESGLEGVKQATEVRGDNRNRMLEVVRIVILDPEKIAGSAQSGKAMELLNEPLVELVDELRAIFEPKFRNLILKLSLTMLVMNARGEETALQTPEGYVPKSMDLTVNWPPIFPPTLDDITKMCGAAVQAATGNLISRETLTRWLGPIFGVENIDEELQKIASQPPPPNPFGGFGGGM